MKPTLRTTAGLVAALVLVPTMLAAAPASAAETKRTISLSATGTTTATPDAVRTSFSVTALAASASKARSMMAASATDVRAALTAAKVPAADLTTIGINVQPEYSYQPDVPATIIGYRATQSWTLTLRDTQRAGEIIDAISAAGGDSVAINGSELVLLDPEKAYDTARAIAVKKAKARAAAYAKLLGLKLGTVSSVTESTGNGGYPYPVYVRDAAGTSSTQIDTGSQQVSVTVQIVWSLR